MEEIIASKNSGSNLHTFSVSEVSQQVKRVVEDAFGYVRVRGEISQFKIVGSGHGYFTLKDAGAVLNAVSWKGTIAKLGCKPEDGLEVIATGKLTIFPGKSQYQLVVERLEPAGVGALMALLEKRKAQLAAEGLFDAVRKKTIPFLPSVIGVVTSPTGAVIRDILHRIGDRMPCRVLVIPVLVQGAGAAEQIARAIGDFNSLSEASGLRPDTIIVARGGGSLEDLWAFNEEIVVRAAAASQIPLISAVGHETDTTLIDFASDKRAPTPTAAAEMAVPVRAELLSNLDMLRTRMHAAMQRNLQHKSEKVQAIARALPRPEQILAIATQRLDDWAERHSASLVRLIERKTQLFSTMDARLAPYLLQPMLQQKTHLLSLASERLRQRIDEQIRSRAEKISILARMLVSLDVRAVMQRGFVLVRNAETGALIPRAAHAQHGAMQLEWVDDTLDVMPCDAAVAITEKSVQKKPPSRAATPTKTSQGDLF